MKDLKLVAGAPGLDRTLHWVHVVELPDVMHWTLGGELLFMTGIGIRFTYRVLGLTPVEATAVFVMIVTLVGINTAPARQILMNLF